MLPAYRRQAYTHKKIFRAALPMLVGVFAYSSSLLFKIDNDLELEIEL